MAKDLRSPAPKAGDEWWLVGGFRLAMVTGAALFYPLLLNLLANVLPDDASELPLLASSFTPGVSILFGTLLSLTVQINIQRQQKIQDLATEESAKIALLTRILLGLFSSDDHGERRAAVATALGVQVSTLVQASRQDELIQILNADPYGSISDAIDEARGVGPLAADARLERGSVLIGEMMQTRSARLSAEANSLPTTHFQILGTLGGLLLLAYALTGAGPSLHGSSSIPIEGSLLFGLLFGTFQQAFNFALDLNRPYDGVYQVRRSAAATNLLSTRLLLDTHLPGGLAFEKRREAAAEGDAMAAGGV